MSDAAPGAGLDATVRGLSSGQKVFNRYTLIRTLGRGGMGIVWLAHDEVLDRDVALKFVPELIVLDPAVLNELRRETKRSLELTHKNIVRIYDFVHDATSACISMEYIDGGTLSGLRVQKENKIFEPDQIADWIIQLCDALDYAHNHARIVHRDLKPSNLMVNQRGDLKVADFGIARSLADSVSMLTHARGTSGTLIYMSPQQLDGEHATHLDDIYSLGATIYELLTSRPPFYSGNIDRQIHEKVPPSMTRRREELEIVGLPIDEAWERMVAACLQKEPGRRPQSSAEMAELLSLEPRKRAPTTRSTEKQVPKRSLLGISFLLISILMVASGWLIKGRFGSPTTTAASTALSSPGANAAATAAPSLQSSSELKSPDEDFEASVERQRAYLHRLFSQHASVTPFPTGTIASFASSNIINSVKFDGVWNSRDTGGPWKGTLTINGGATASISLYLVQKLPPKSDHWNLIPSPYNRSRTLSYRWNTQSAAVRPSETIIDIDWNEWKLTWEPSGMPYAVLTKVYRKAEPGQFNVITPPNRNWRFTLDGSELVSASWKFQRDR